MKHPFCGNLVCFFSNKNLKEKCCDNDKRGEKSNVQIITLKKHVEKNGPYKNSNGIFCSKCHHRNRHRTKSFGKKFTKTLPVSKFIFHGFFGKKIKWEKGTKNKEKTENKC